MSDMDRRLEVNKMDKLRRALKNNDEIEIDLDEAFFNRLHDKIMAQVEETPMAAPASFGKTRRMLRAHWRSWLYPAGGLMSVILVASLLSPLWLQLEKTLQRSGLLSDGEQRIASEAVLSLEDLSQTLIVSQSEADFFMDVANNSIENLSVDKLKKALGKKSN